ncbi:MAG: efflux RND transporter periplasmic adaptor subunit [Aquificae bacterium]|nr:efflux RND transporter periplasmic adaptor subunit [Aquificota bacterium]
MAVIKAFLVALTITALAFAQHHHHHDHGETHQFKLTSEIIQKLGIKWQEVKKVRVSINKKYPAVVKDDLNLSQIVSSPVEGLVNKLFVMEGDKVKKGQKVALIYSPQIKQLLAEIRMAKVQLANAKAVFEREAKLFKKELIPYNRYFEAKIKLDNAKARLKALRETLASYGEVQNGLLVLRSGMDGYVAEQEVVLGESVDVGKMLTRIHKFDTLWVVALVPVEDSQIFKSGDTVSVISPIGRTTGKVAFTSTVLDPETKRGKVRILTDNTNRVLKPNMFVDVFVSKQSEEGLYIPTEAVVIKDGKYFVFVKEGDTVKVKEVSVGEKIGRYYRITDGLTEGEVVITAGTSFLKSKFLAEAEGH